MSSMDTGPTDHPKPDVESDPGLDDETGSDWTDEGGATDEGPATDPDLGSAARAKDR